MAFGARKWDIMPNSEGEVSRSMRAVPTTPEIRDFDWWSNMVLDSTIAPDGVELRIKSLLLIDSVEKAEVTVKKMNR